MAATFVVEDGTGKTDANSYISVADADQYNENHANDSAWVGAGQADKEKGLRLATQYIDARFNARWKGRRVNEDQALDWPRWGVQDEDDYYIDSDVVPTQVKNACVELAIKQVGGEELMPDLSDPGTVKSTSVKVGPIAESITCLNGNSPIKRFRLVDDILSDLVWPPGAIRRG